MARSARGGRASHHDYNRNGTTTLFAALNVLDGSVVGQCMQRHRHQEFLRFLKVHLPWLDQQWLAGSRNGAVVAHDQPWRTAPDNQGIELACSRAPEMDPILWKPGPRQTLFLSLSTPRAPFSEAFVKYFVFRLRLDMNLHYPDEVPIW